MGNSLANPNQNQRNWNQNNLGACPGIYHNQANAQLAYRNTGALLRDNNGRALPNDIQNYQPGQYRLRQDINNQGYVWLDDQDGNSYQVRQQDVDSYSQRVGSQNQWNLSQRYDNLSQDRSLQNKYDDLRREAHNARVDAYRRQNCRNYRNDDY